MASELIPVPGRLLLDTCILNRLYDEGGYIFDGAPAIGTESEEEVEPDLRALRAIFLVNQRADFQLLISPLTVAEVANTQQFSDRSRRLGWVLEVLDHWLIMLDETGSRVAAGGSVRHRFKLTPELQAFESALLEIPDFRRDPFDRVLLIQYKMGDCDAFLTTDRDTIWRHRVILRELGVCVLTPSEYWELLRPWAALWR
jgi:hypothetical protein